VISGFHDPKISTAHNARISGFHEPIVSGAHTAVLSNSHKAVVSGGHGGALSRGHDPNASSVHDAVVSGAHNPFASGLHGATLSGAHDPTLSGAHTAALSGAHAPTLSSIKDATHDEFISKIHDPAASTAHDAVNSSSHDAFLSGVHNAQLSGAHDPAASGVHTSFESGLHAPALSGAHDPTISGGHDAAISRIHDAVLSGGHDAALSALHDPVVSGSHNATLSGAHEPSLSGAHTTALSGGHDPAVSALHSPADSAGGHVAVISGLHAAALSSAHDATASGLHDAVVSATHDATVSTAHEPGKSSQHAETTSTLHNPVASGGHDASISTAHSPNLSGLHTPDLSGGHDAALSATHSPVASTWGGADGTPPTFDFGDLFGAPTVVIDGSASAIFGPDSPAGLFFSPSIGLGASPAFFTTSFAQQLVTIGVISDTRLDDSLALSLGLKVGARRVVLASGAEAILPVDFAFTAAWDTPPVGSIFDLGANTGGLILAPTGSSLPAGLSGWTQDFFLPGSTTSVKIGFSAVVFTGTSGTAVADFAKTITTGLDTIFRFNAATQTWGSYSPNVPSFANSISTLNARDTLFIKATGVSSFNQVDLVPRDGSSRALSLSKGSNLVGYTGASGDASAVLGGIAGLQTAFWFDSATQTWLSYSPSSPSFVNTLKTVSRLDGLFLILDSATSWTYAEAP
jgi:hypothetical protein